MHGWFDERTGCCGRMPASQLQRWRRAWVSAVNRSTPGQSVQARMDQSLETRLADAPRTGRPCTVAE